MAVLQVTGFGYEHDEAWSANMELFKELTDVSRGVRRLGAAAVDLCHVALGLLSSQSTHLQPRQYTSAAIASTYQRRH